MSPSGSGEQQPCCDLPLIPLSAPQAPEALNTECQAGRQWLPGLQFFLYTSQPQCKHLTTFPPLTH